MDVDKPSETTCDANRITDGAIRIDPEVAHYCEAMVSVASECEKMFVEMYRSCYPHLFISLVKLQLSFLVDLPLELMLSNGEDESFADTSAASVRQPSPIRRVFRLGTRDDEHELAPALPISSQLLMGFRCLFNYLRSGNRLSTPFLFRVPGSTTRVTEIRHLLLRNESDNSKLDYSMINLENSSYSPHDIASALKQGLSAVSTNCALLTAPYRPLFAQISRITTPRPDESGVCHPLRAGDSQLFACKQLKAIRLLLLLLPEVNCNVLLELLDLLKAVSETEASCMNAKALGIIFGPVLFPPPDSILHEDEATISRHCLEHNAMVTFMIEQYPGVREIPSSIVTAISAILDAHNNPEEAPSTVSYVTRRRTGEEVARAYTEYAISELYAHVAKWPDSTRKRRVVRKISKMNGGIAPSVMSELGRAARQNRDTQPKRSNSARSRLRPRVEKRPKPTDNRSDHEMVQDD